MFSSIISVSPSQLQYSRYRSTHVHIHTYACIHTPILCMYTYTHVNPRTREYGRFHIRYTSSFISRPPAVALSRFIACDLPPSHSHSCSSEAYHPPPHSTSSSSSSSPSSSDLTKLTQSMLTLKRAKMRASESTFWYYSISFTWRESKDRICHVSIYCVLFHVCVCVLWVLCVCCWFGWFSIHFGASDFASAAWWYCYMSKQKEMLSCALLLAALILTSQVAHYTSLNTSCFLLKMCPIPSHFSLYIYTPLDFAFNLRCLRFTHIFWNSVIFITYLYISCNCRNVAPPSPKTHYLCILYSLLEEVPLG